LPAIGYTEATTTGGGPGILGLNVASRTTTSLPTFLGLQVDTSTVFSNGAALAPYARASWVHEFEPNRQLAATFVSVPTAGFTVDGARAARNAARLDAGMKFVIDSSRSLFANLMGELGGGGSSYAATAGFRFVR
jgi:outer membrane autotransporter protein